MNDTQIAPVAIEVHHLEAPLATPRRNAFGEMRARPALLVRLVDASGAEGWGEAFCNWPAFAARHRALILKDILAPLAIGRRHDSPEDFWRDLTARTHRLVLQCDEPGPFAQTIAALDMAAWGAVAAREGCGLDILWGTDPTLVRTYASALTGGALDAVPALAASGWQGFKVKVGFGLDHDLETLARMRDLAGPEAHLMADANQAWTLSEARTHTDAFAAHDLAWLEEPLAADTKSADWAALSNATSIPIAAGENLRGETAFVQAMTAGVAVMQPDAAKWGGLSGLRRIAHAAKVRGISFAPHYLGGAVGLRATAAAAAALGADWLEVDATANPLRTDLGIDTTFRGGTSGMNTGLTMSLDPGALARFAVK